MTRGDGVDEGAVGTTVGVTTALDELKSRGSALLVVGTVPESSYARLSARLLGEGPDRRRLIVEQRRSPAARLAPVGRWTPEWTRVFRCQITPHRSAAAADDTGTTQPPQAGQTPGADPQPTAGSSDEREDGDENEDGYGGVVEPVDGSITDLGVTAGDVIAWFDDIAGGLAPAELRVALDCVVPLLSAYPDRTVFRFLHLLSCQIRSVGGMGHVRLARPLESTAVRLLAPLFDAVVELRLDGTEPVHRWHLRDAGVTSEWLPVDPTA